MPQQYAVGMQGAFGRTCGAGGIDQHGRVICAGVQGTWCRFRVGGNGLPQGQRLALILLAVTLIKVFELRQMLAQWQQCLQALLIGNQGAGTGIIQPVAQCVRAKQGEQGHGDGANLVGGQMRQSRFQPLRQKDGDTIACLYALGLPGGGQRVGPGFELIEGVALDLTVGQLLDQGQTSGAIRPFVAGVVSDVVVLGDGPVKFRVAL